MPNNDLQSIQVIIYHFLITKFGETHNYIPEMHQSSLIYLHTQLKLNIMETKFVYLVTLEASNAVTEVWSTQEEAEAAINNPNGAYKALRIKAKVVKRYLWRKQN